MKKVTRSIAAAALALAMVGAVPICSTPLRADGRDTMKNVVADKGDAVVTLEIVFETKFSSGGQERQSDRKAEVPGFLIDEKGTALTTLSNVDPGQFYSTLYDKEDSYVTRVKSIKYILGDTTEIPAAIVLRDGDLDIAVLRPLSPPEKPMTFISLSESTKPALLDQAYTLGRMPRIARRTVVGMSGEVQAVVDRPRTFYVPSSELVTARAGVPVFGANGKLIGMVALYIFPGGRKSAGENDEPYMYVIRPADDLVQVAEQAKDAPLETPAPAEESVAKPEESAEDSATTPAEPPPGN